MSAKHDHTSLVSIHYMPIQSLTLDHMSYFVLGFPLLGTTEYPQAPFTVAKVSHYWIQWNTLIPLLHLAALLV
jgi:hypothetical protein